MQTDLKRRKNNNAVVFRVLIFSMTLLPDLTFLFITPTSHPHPPETPKPSFWKRAFLGAGAKTNCCMMFTDS
jgi:hypothetical protein